MDSSEIDNALVAKLASDSELLAMMPNGIYYGLAAEGSTRFVLVTLETATDIAQFGGRAIEERYYLIEAVGLSSTNPAMQQAAARIDQLLEDQPLTIDGYDWMTTYRIEPRRAPTEPDESNRSLRWFRRGGVYKVAATPAPVIVSAWMQDGWVQEGWTQ